MEELRLLLERVAGHLRLKSENRVLRETIKSRQASATSSAVRPIWKSSTASSPKRDRASIPCSSSAKRHGKELVAKSIHFSGVFRNSHSFPSIADRSCHLDRKRALRHVRGAFTGATNPKDGLLAIAKRHRISRRDWRTARDLQAKLLRAIQEKEIRPVGSVKRVPSTCAFSPPPIATSNGRSRSTFRRDLFFRLNVLTAHSPSARAPPGHPLLVAHILERIGTTPAWRKRSQTRPSRRF